MLLTQGTRLGPYEVLAPLGAGGMGEVYRARDTRLGRDVAIKSLPQAFLADSERLARFRREAQTLASLNHPNIAAIYGLEEVDGTPYLVLELVAGETLTARLARGPLPVREALAIGIQIAAAIETAHERGVIHRDLKPGNVMITGTDVAKVLDFGLAKSDPALASGGGSSETPTMTAHAERTVAGTLIGTVAYMSPEQARGKALDRRSDVWSFGCVLYECLSGMPAFGGETASDLIARILEREPDWSALPPRVPPRVREILRRCLRKDADARPRDIRDVRLELIEVGSATGKSDAGREQSVAVLPFDNLSGPDDEYFADGVTDEILSRLSQLEGLRVAARTSCFAFKGRRENLRLIGEELDVTTLLEGSVRRAGTRLRITVQLVNAADGYQLWSERYDREMTDVFEVQDEIAGSIAGRLRGTLYDQAARGRARQGTRNLEAYELFLKGRSLQGKRGRFLPQATECFEQALVLDPNYAEAMAWLSDSYRLMGTFGVAPYSDAMPKAERLAERALEIDPTQAEAWVTLASIEEQFMRNFGRARELWERALAMDPRHSRGRAQRAFWGYCHGAFSAEESAAEMDRAVEEDPLNAWLGAMRSHLLGFLGRPQDSLVAANRAFELEPDSFFAHWNLLRAHAMAGQYDRAIAIGPAICGESGRNPWALGALAWTFGKVGQRDRAKALHDEMEARSRFEFMSPFWLATAAASAGLPDETIRYVERAVAERDPLLLWGRGGTAFWDAVKMHPRFDDVVREVWG
jgi:serine/threonine-protein kinase